MKHLKIFCFFIIPFFIIGCTVRPQKIEYGKDTCSFCKMTIVETKFASEIVTKKGRSSKYDAIECMVNDIKDINKNTLAYILVTDYTIPEKLIDATKATYLISKKTRSPMGAYLSAYESEYDAKQNGTKLFNWETLKKHFYN